MAECISQVLLPVGEENIEITDRKEIREKGEKEIR
jgi:hypothetical protein